MYCLFLPILWRLAGGERGSRLSQADLDHLCERVRPSKHAPRGPFRLLERRHGLAEIVDGGAHPFTKRLAEFELRDARAVLQAATLEQEK